MDFSKYKLKLTFRAMCLWEVMTGRSYFTLSAELDDILKLTYCMIIANNDSLAMDYNTFLILINDKKVSKWVNDEYKKIAAMNSTFAENDKEEKTDEVKSSDGEPMKMADVVSSLIIQYKLDPHYVMNEMQMWEIRPYMQCAENVKKAEMVEKRMWTYLTIMPHIDTKKCKSPEKLLPFEWEAEDRKNNAKKDLENNRYAIKNLIGKKLDWIK